MSADATPEDAWLEAHPTTCEFVDRTGRLHTCNRPHCVGCGSHFTPPAHVHCEHCDACLAWMGKTPQRVRLEAMLAEFVR